LGGIIKREGKMRERVDNDHDEEREGRRDERGPSVVFSSKTCVTPSSIDGKKEEGREGRKGRIWVVYYQQQQQRE